MDTRIGQMRHLVTWEQPGTARDSMGQVNGDLTYTTLAQRYAYVKAVKSMERLNEQPQGQTTYTVFQRSCPNLDLTCRMNYAGKIFEVVGILNIDLMNAFQEITVVDAGLSAQGTTT